MIFIPIILGVFLRIFKIRENYYFPGESGRELLYAWQMDQLKEFPLIGLTTSHEWLSYGPIYYWILNLPAKIFAWSPYVLFWLSLSVSVAGILVTYFVFKKICGEKFALVLSFIISFSPLWIWSTRLSKLHTFLSVLIPLIIFFLYKVWKGKLKYIFWLGLVYGATFSFHFSQLPILAVIVLVFWIKKEKIHLKDYILFISGMIISNLTVIFYDYQNGFNMLKNLVLWIPYRIAGFGGILPRNNLTFETLTDTIFIFNEFLGRNMFIYSKLWISATIVFLILFTIFILENFKKIQKDFFIFYLISSTLLQFVSLFVHTKPPLHYFLPVFLNFPLLLSYFFVKYQKKQTVKIFLISILIFMFVEGVFMHKYEHLNNTDFIPLSRQEEVVREIIRDSQNNPFSLERIGPFDHFPENYSQNYKFLILKSGGKIDESAKTKFVIYDFGKVFVQKYERD